MDGWVEREREGGWEVGRLGGCGEKESEGERGRGGEVERKISPLPFRTCLF